jgi:hypothetical protein
MSILFDIANTGTRLRFCEQFEGAMSPLLFSYPVLERLV